MRSTPKTWAAKEARETATTAQVPACACHLDDRLRQSLVLLQQCVQVASGNVLQDEPYMAASSIPVVELQRVGVPQFVHDVHLVLDLRTTRSAWHANWRTCVDASAAYPGHLCLVHALDGHILDRFLATALEYDRRGPSAHLLIEMVVIHDDRSSSESGGLAPPTTPHGVPSALPVSAFTHSTTAWRTFVGRYGTGSGGAYGRRSHVQFGGSCEHCQAPSMPGMIGCLTDKCLNGF